jgi:putative SOS response-associated peptidase YedK
MCGRYALHTLLGELQEHFGLFDEFEFKPRYNIAPSYHLPIVREDDTGRHLALAQWGFVPAWSKETPKVKPINARADTVAEKPFFRTAFKKHRCLIPANGFYEWKRDGKQKQPYYFRLKDSELLAFAGIWDRWTGEEGPLDTFAIITTDANDTMRPVHDRMPVILGPEDYGGWLKTGDKKLLVPYPKEMTCYPISRRVNSPANDNEEIIERLGTAAT